MTSSDQAQVTTSDPVNARSVGQGSGQRFCASQTSTSTQISKKLLLHRPLFVMLEGSAPCVTSVRMSLT